MLRCSVHRGTRCRGKSMDFLTGTWRSVKDFRKGGRRRACVVDLVTAARVNITSMAAKFSSRRRKHKPYRGSGRRATATDPSTVDLRNYPKSTESRLEPATCSCVCYTCAFPRALFNISKNNNQT